MTDTDFAPLAHTIVHTMELHAAQKEESIHCAENALSSLGKKIEFQFFFFQLRTHSILFFLRQSIVT